MEKQRTIVRASSKGHSNRVCNTHNEAPTNRPINIGGAYAHIFVAMRVATLPLLILSATLLGLIFRYRANQAHDASSSFLPQLVTAVDESAYFVDFSATRLLTLASWTSSVAPMLPMFAMNLISYPVAQRILRSSKPRQARDLPTRYQIHLYLELLEGGVGSLWKWFKYRTWKRR